MVDDEPLSRMVRPRLVRHAAFPFDLLLERLAGLPSVDFDRDPLGHADLPATVVDELVPFREDVVQILHFPGPRLCRNDTRGGERIAG